MSVNRYKAEKFKVKTVRNSQQRLELAGMENSRGWTMAAADPKVLELRSQA